MKRFLERGACAAALTAAMTSAGSASAEEVLTSSRFPIHVHHELADAAFAAKVLGHAESSWQYQVLEQRFLAPPADAGAFGSDDYDVFIEPNPYLAYVEPLEPALDRPNGFTSRMVVDPGLPDFVLPLIVSHELHHAMQCGICFGGPNAIGESGAVYVSGTERAGEAKFLSYFLGFNDFQAQPQRALDWMGAIGDYYPYGSALLWIYLDQAHGDGTPLRQYKAVLDKMRDAPAQPRGACPDYLALVGERVDLDDAYGDFARWRYFLGEHDDGEHFQNVGQWEGNEASQKIQSVELAGHLLLSSLPVANAAPDGKVMRYGTAYVALDLGGIASEESIVLRFQGDAEVAWRIGVIRVGLGLDGEEVLVVPAAGSLEASLSPDGAERLVFAFSNHGGREPPGPPWGPASFTYGLERVASEVPPTDPPEEPDPADSAEPEQDAMSGGEGCACSLPARRGGSAGALLLACLAALRRRRRH